MSDFDPIDDYEPHGFSADYARKVTKGYSAHLPPRQQEDGGRPMTPHTDSATTLAAAKAELDAAIERRNYELRVFHKDGYLINRRIEQAKSDYIAALEARLRQQDAELAQARAALQAFVAGDSWMEHERVSSHNICHYCGEKFSGWLTPDRHSEDCPVLAAEAALAATAQADDAAEGG